MPFVHHTVCILPAFALCLLPPPLPAFAIYLLHTFTPHTLHTLLKVTFLPTDLPAYTPVPHSATYPTPPFTCLPIFPHATTLTTLPAHPTLHPTHAVLRALRYVTRYFLCGVRRGAFVRDDNDGGISILFGLCMRIALRGVVRVCVCVVRACRYLPRNALAAAAPACARGRLLLDCAHCISPRARAPFARSRNALCRCARAHAPHYTLPRLPAVPVRAAPRARTPRILYASLLPLHRAFYAFYRFAAFALCCARTFRRCARVRTHFARARTHTRVARNAAAPYGAIFLTLPALCRSTGVPSLPPAPPTTPSCCTIDSTPPSGCLPRGSPPLPTYLPSLPTYCLLFYHFTTTALPFTVVVLPASACLLALPCLLPVLLPYIPAYRLVGLPLHTFPFSILPVWLFCVCVNIVPFAGARAAALAAITAWLCCCQRSAF